MKTLPLLIVTGGLLCATTLVSACPADHRGPHGGMGMSEMDKNGDGMLDKKEFTAFHEQRFRELDTNHDGKISQDEMGSPQGCSTKRGLGRFDSRFDETDINHDGALSKDEAEIGMPMLFAHFDEIDANKDGKISKDEVVANMKKMHAERGSGMQRKP